MLNEAGSHCTYTLKQSFNEQLRNLSDELKAIVTAKANLPPSCTATAASKGLIPIGDEQGALRYYSCAGSGWLDQRSFQASGRSSFAAGALPKHPPAFEHGWDSPEQISFLPLKSHHKEHLAVPSIGAATPRCELSRSLRPSPSLATSVSLVPSPQLFHKCLRAWKSRKRNARYSHYTARCACGTALGVGACSWNT